MDRGQVKVQVQDKWAWLEDSRAYGVKAKMLRGLYILYISTRFLFRKARYQACRSLFVMGGSDLYRWE